MDVAERIHEQLTRCGITLAASLPDDWVAPLIERIAADNHIRHVRVAREAEAVAICSGAFFGGVRAVALMGATGLLTCTGELATRPEMKYRFGRALDQRFGIEVFGPQGY